MNPKLLFVSYYSFIFLFSYFLIMKMKKKLIAEIHEGLSICRLCNSYLALDISQYFRYCHDFENIGLDHVLDIKAGFLANLQTGVFCIWEQFWILFFNEIREITIEPSVGNNKFGFRVANGCARRLLLFFSFIAGLAGPLS